MSANYIEELFQNAREAGDISDATYEVLKKAGVAGKLESQTGLSVTDIIADEVILVATQIDNTKSIVLGGNKEAVKKGHNGVVDALCKVKLSQRRRILFKTQYLNSGYVLNDWVKVGDALPITDDNYSPASTSPLYDSTVLLLGSLIAEVQKAKKQRKKARCGVLLVGDGYDEYSEICTAEDVRTIVSDLRKAKHTIALMGIPYEDVDFHRIASEMGISGEWILTPDSDEKSIRRAFDTFSKEMDRDIASAQNDDDDDL